MTSNRDLELIQSYHDKTDDMIEKKILSHILDELKTRIPVERNFVNGTCPICGTHIIDSKAQYCYICGQAIE